MAADTATRILVLGDSLTAGYGLAAEDAFPARLEAALRARGHAVKVIDAGVSGDTTAGGLARLDWALAGAPDMVIVELGANDAPTEPAASERSPAPRRAAADAPFCMTCGVPMRRAGACFVCGDCGTTSGCS